MCPNPPIHPYRYSTKSCFSHRALWEFRGLGLARLVGDIFALYKFIVLIERRQLDGSAAFRDAPRRGVWPSLSSNRAIMDMNALAPFPETSTDL